MANDATCIGATAVPSTSLTLPPLADNGGSTWTHALLPGSPAIDAGDDAACPSTDQRDVARPQGLHCDIGAYEFVADTRYVATTGVDAGNVCLDSAAPCATVQHAVDVAHDGDQVLIASGVYTNVSVRPRNDITTTGVVTQMVYLSKTVTIQGGYTTTNWITPDPATNPTVLDAQNQGRVFYITGDISPTIEGLHIQGGYETDQDNHCAPVGFCARVGTGIYGINAHVAVNAAWIENNQGEVANFGGAVFVENGQLRLDSSHVISNVGSGVFLNNSTGLLTDNVISGNTASNGGGVQLLLSTATLSNNQILSNTANYACGGGICAAYTSTLILAGNVIRGNRIEVPGFDRDGGGISIFYRSQG